MSDISIEALERGMAKVKELFPKMASKLEIKQCDVSKETDVAAMVEHLDSWGGCDVIFNNAGIMHADDAGMAARFPTTFRHPSMIIDSSQTPLTRQRRSGT